MRQRVNWPEKWKMLDEALKGVLPAPGVVLPGLPPPVDVAQALLPAPQAAGARAPPAPRAQAQVPAAVTSEQDELAGGEALPAAAALGVAVLADIEAVVPAVQVVPAGTAAAALADAPAAIAVEVPADVPADIAEEVPAVAAGVGRLPTNTAVYEQKSLYHRWRQWPWEISRFALRPGGVSGLHLRYQRRTGLSNALGTSRGGLFRGHFQAV